MTISQGKSSQQRKQSRRRSPRNQKKNRRWLLGMMVSTMVISGGAFYYRVKQALLRPEVIFVLGGHEEREEYAAQLAQDNPALEVWVSSGSPPAYAQQIFDKYGVAGDRLTLDYRAEDTVTNFTSIVDEFKAQNIDSVYLITSENHMQRANIVGQIIFGSQGIAVKPLAVPSQNPPESTIKCLRDGLRSLLWVFTGETGAEWFEKNYAAAETIKNL